MITEFKEVCLAEDLQKLIQSHPDVRVSQPIYLKIMSFDKDVLVSVKKEIHRGIIIYDAETIIEADIAMAFKEKK